MSDFCDPKDNSQPGSSVHGISQARILEWVAISFSRALPNPGTEPSSPALAAGFFLPLSHEGSPQINIIVEKTENQQGPTAQHRELYSVFCNNV